MARFLHPETSYAAPGRKPDTADVTHFTGASRMPPFSMPPITLELALLAGRAVFLVFCFVLAAVTFTRWRRAADRNAELFMQQTATVLERIAALETRIESLQTSQTDLAEKVSGLATTGTGPS